MSLPQPAECESFGLTVHDFDAQAVAVLHCVGDLTAVSYAWQYLFRSWLPNSAYQPAHLRGFEVFVRTPEELGWETFDLYGCLPIVSL
ncbi:MAG TPA: hypothetical protein DEA55_08025 [Rhodospirillaceae bacterium]|nr:hypothetical protein [Rhodospirillaceae bacterium]